MLAGQYVEEDGQVYVVASIQNTQVTGPGGLPGDAYLFTFVPAGGGERFTRISHDKGRGYTPASQPIPPLIPECRSCGSPAGFACPVECRVGQSRVYR